MAARGRKIQVAVGLLHINLLLGVRVNWPNRTESDLCTPLLIQLVDGLTPALLMMGKPGTEFKLGRKLKQ